LSGIFVTDGKNKTENKKNRKKTSVKHIRIRLIGGCVNYEKNAKISTPIFVQQQKSGGGG